MKTKNINSINSCKKRKVCYSSPFLLKREDAPLIILKTTKSINKESSSKENKKNKKGLPTSKSTKKFKINLKQSKEEYNCENSDREYFFVNQGFVPIKKFEDEKFFETLLPTATSEYFYKAKNIEKSNLSLEKIKLDDKIEQLVVEKLKKKSIREFEINTELLTEEIGIQYSTRYFEENFSCVNEKQTELKITKTNESLEIKEEEPTTPIRSVKIFDNNKDKKEEEEEGENCFYKSKLSESLSDILLRLEFQHLGNDEAFKELSTTEKEHYCQLLQCMMNKLVEKKMIETKPRQNSIIPEAILIEKQQEEIFNRECIMVGSVEAPILESPQFNTCLQNVLETLYNFFYYLEMNEGSTLITMLSKSYGLTYQQKYFSITRAKKPSIENNKVIPRRVLMEFLNEMTHEEKNQYEIIHTQAIFDAFNEMLETYRPFYSSNGQNFPWLFSINISLNEYLIDENSIGIIFNEIKDKIVDAATSLCGLHVSNVDSKSNKILIEKRKEKEIKLAQEILEPRIWMSDLFEIATTTVVHEIAEFVYYELILEMNEIL